MYWILIRDLDTLILDRYVSDTYLYISQTYNIFVMCPRPGNK